MHAFVHRITFGACNCPSNLLLLNIDLSNALKIIIVLVIALYIIAGKSITAEATQKSFYGFQTVSLYNSQDLDRALFFELGST